MNKSNLEVVTFNMTKYILQHEGMRLMVLSNREKILILRYSILVYDLLHNSNFNLSRGLFLHKKL